VVEATGPPGCEKAAVKVLDAQIVEAFSVVSLLIAIAAAYLAGIWPIVNDLLHGKDPDVEIDADGMARRCGAYALSASALAVVNLLVMALLFPLLADVVASFSTSGPFHTVRAALVLVELLLLSGCATSGVLAFRLHRRKEELTLIAHGS
jgi:hypothetical protein